MAKDLTAGQLAEAYKSLTLIGQNLRGCVLNGKLLMEVDLDVELGLSSTQQTFLKCNSGGPKHVIGFPPDVKINVTMTRKNPDYVKPPKA